MMQKPNSSQSKKQAGPPMSVSERLSEKAMKTMEKATEQQTMARLQQGQSPEEILAALNSFAQTPVAKPGSMVGLIPALAQLIQGNPTNPFAQRTQPLGLDNAIKIQNLGVDMSEAARRQAASNRKAPGESAKSQTELVKAAQIQAQVLGDYSLLEALAAQSGVNNQISDPAFDPAFRAEYGQQELKRTYENRAELDKYVRTAQPILSSFMKFQDIAEKLPDYKGGILNQMIARGDTVAKAISADPVISRLNSAIDFSLGLIVKSNGDTGNLAEQEQQRAKDAIGNASLPLAVKIQIYNDTMERVLDRSETLSVQAKEKNLGNKYPIFKKARERYQKNKTILDTAKDKNKLTVDNLFEGLE